MLAFRPVLRRLAIRNLVRRPREAALVVLGSMLGTAILTGSFVVGDTLEATFRRGIHSRLGPIDEVAVAGAQESGEIRRRVATFRHPDVDGVLEFTMLEASVATRGAGRRASPRSQVIELDFGAARRFGGDPEATGVRGDTPRPGQAVITRDLANRLGLRAGDGLDVFTSGKTLPLTVARVIPVKGVVGFGLGFGVDASNVFVSPGTIAALAGPGGPSAPPSAGFGGFGGGFGPFGGIRTGSGRPQLVVAVSNTGGVIDGAAHTDAVRPALEQTLQGTTAQVRAVKRQLLRQADQAGTAFSAIFTAMSSFGVIAGMLLLANIFVMLSEERRGELGMLRAVGMRRSWLVLAFSTEGWMYAIVSGALGALVGIGLGNVVANLATSIFASAAGATEVDPVFAASGASVQRGFALGFLIAISTIVITSVRLSRFNVIRAIRDIDEPAVRHRSLRGLIGGIAVVALGALWLLGSLSRSEPFGMYLAPLLLLTGACWIAVRFAPRRTTISAAAALAIAWGTFGVRFLENAGSASIVLFVGQGVVLSAAAIVLVSQNQDAIGAALRRVGGGSRALGLRLGLAYPLSRRFRTGMTLAMYTLVMFMLTFITAFTHMAFSQIDRFSRSAIGGFDIAVSSNPTNPVAPDALARREGVAGVAPVDTALGEVILPGKDEPSSVILSAFDERWIALVPPTLADNGRYATDAEAYRAVLADPGLIVVNPALLSFATSSDDEEGGVRVRFGGGRDLVKIGDTLQLRNPRSGDSRDVRIAALAGGGFGGQAAWYGAPGMRALLGDRIVSTSLFVAAKDGVDPDTLASQISGAYIENGADATALATQLATAQSSFLGFAGLIRGYLGLGLLVGIAGLGVVMVRAVRERRRQIGVLRALGFEASTIRRAFVIESAFVALEGVLAGVVLALVTVWSVVTLSGDAENALTFSVPIGQLAVIVGGTLVASLLATAAPSQAASRIRPAVALRIAD